MNSSNVVPELAPAEQTEHPKDKGARISKEIGLRARHLTLQNNSRRNLYKLAGLPPRVRDQIFDKILAITFILIFVIPCVAGISYFAFFASPHYVSETRFVLRSAVPVLTRNRFSGDGAEPSAKIVQDTQIVVSYLKSLDFLTALEEQIDFAQIYGRSDIDFVWRLESDASREDRLDYWERMLDSKIGVKSGIVTLEVSAFSPSEAQQLLSTTMQLAEDRINKLNEGIWSSLVETTKTDVDNAIAALENVRIKFQDAQNESGIFDVSQTAESMSEIITEIRRDITNLSSERDALTNVLSENSSNILALDRQIAARQKQLQELTKAIAGQRTTSRPVLSEYSRRFSELELEREIAERRFRVAVRELERVKLLSSLQLVYLDRFTAPTLADEKDFPKPFLMSLLTLLFAGAAWGATYGLIVVLQKKMD